MGREPFNLFSEVTDGVGKTDGSGDGRGFVDRAYDVLEQGASALGAVLGVDVGPVATPSSTHPIARARAISSRVPLALPPARRAFVIEEALSSAGRQVFVVTNGVERAECPSRPFAEQVLIALRAKGAK